MTKNTTCKYALSVTALSALLVLCDCQAPEPVHLDPYEPKAQNVRAWKRLHAEDIAVAQVRVVKTIDLDCAGLSIPIPVSGSFDSANDAFAAYWKRAMESELSQAGMLNEKSPKVRLYALIDSVKIQAEPTRLAWIMNLEMFSSNGTSMKESVVYNAPTDGLKNMREGCFRLAKGLDKALTWALLKTTSDPRFEALVQPGLGFTPSMKAQSLQETLLGEEEDERWKETPRKK